MSLIAVRESDALPVWQEYFDERGRIVRRLNYGEVRTFGRRTIPSLLEMIPENKQGYKTVIRYRDIQFDLALEDSLFSLRSLRSMK